MRKQVQPRALLTKSAAASQETAASASEEERLRRALEASTALTETLRATITQLNEEMVALRLMLAKTEATARSEAKAVREEAAKREEFLREELRQMREIVAKAIAQGGSAGEGGSWAEVVRRKPARQQAAQQQQRRPQQSQQRANERGQQWQQKGRLLQQSRQRQQQQHQVRPDTIEVTPAEGATWTQAYLKLRTAPELEEVRTAIGMGRRTTQGHLRVPISRSADSETLTAKIQDVLGDMGAVRVLTEMGELLITHVDPLATVEDVKDAIQAKLGATTGITFAEVWELSDGTKRARVRLPLAKAQLLYEAKLSICQLISLAHEVQRRPHRSPELWTTACTVSGVKQQLRVLQANLGGGRTAQDFVLQTARTERIDVLILSEVYHPPENSGTWTADSSGAVAVVATGAHPIQRVWSSPTPGVVAAQIGGVVFISCYAPPRLTIAEFEHFLEALELEALSHPHVVVAGDFNAWHEEWGSQRNNMRGEGLLNTIQQLGLRILNRGTTPTFVGNGVATPSVVDVSFASESIARPETWAVASDSLARHYTASDHRYIFYTVGPSSPPQHQRQQQQHQNQRWKASQFSVEAFRVALRAANFEERADSQEGMVDAMLRACDETMARVTTLNRDPHRSLFWWTPELTRLREECAAARDRMIAMVDLQERSLAAAHHRTARRTMEKAIRASKRAEFDDLIRLAEENEFGAGYRAVMSRLRGSYVPPETDKTELLRISGDLFPTHPTVEWPAEGEAEDGQSLTPVTTAELLAIVECMANRKAPGVDGIPNAAVRTAIREYPEVFRRLYQDCLDRGVFPAPWKRQRLVLLPKPGKPPGESGSYRPLCMLDALGKVLERLILTRLNLHLEDTEAPRLSEHQYGFRKGRSTISAIQRVVEMGRTAMSFRRTNQRDNRCLMVVALDVRNAFNTASWQSIANVLQEKGVPSALRRMLRSYFEDRRLIIETSEGPVEQHISAGVPQGSILGPTLWNVLYDGVLGVPLPQGTELIGYADDLVLLVPAVTPEAAASKAESAIATISSWMSHHRLALAPEKTEMTVISSLKRPPAVSINIDGVAVPASRSIRYLGVWLQDHLSWLPHVEKAAAKAEKVAQAVTRLLPNHSGPKSSRARLLAAVADSILRYGAPVWSEGLERRQCRRLVSRVQRKTAIRVCRAFRTVRGETAVLLAGLIPICRLIDEDSRVYHHLHQENRTSTSEQVRAIERERTYEVWQAEWDANAESEEASRYTRWAHRVVPDVKAWQSRKHGDVTFQLAQVLSGHGFFRDYLCNMGFTSSPDCQRCPGVAETAEHAVFRCPRFAAVREELLGGTDPVSPDTILSCLLESPDRWSQVCEAAQRITNELQDDWNAEREMLAAQDGEPSQRDNSVAIARNQRRNAARRAATAARREAARGGRPPSPPPSPTTEARRAAVRERVARWRARRRESHTNIIGNLFGEQDWVETSSGNEEQDNSYSGLTAAEAAAAGSILGPTLWNVMYDGVLSVPLPPGAEIIGYADDLVLLAPGTTPTSAAATAEEAVSAVDRWLREHHLELAHAKTEMTIISSLKKPPVGVTITVGGVVVQYSRTLKYLGVRLQDHLSWVPHVTAITEKATQVAQAVNRLMPNHRGPKTSKSRLLAAVADSVMRYAAPVWHGALANRECRRLLQRVQRSSAIRVARAFATVRYDTAVLMAGLVPICRAVEEDTRVHSRRGTRTSGELRIEERQRTIAEWQSAWDADAAAEGASRYVRWAHRTIPDIGSWQSRNHGEVTFHLPQVLSGHGFFREYLSDMGFTSSPDCTCHMLQCPENWSNVCEAAKRITHALQRDWDEFRTLLAAQGMLPDNAHRPNPEAVRRARYDRRNVARNRQRAQEREERRDGRPPSPPPSPKTEARRAAVRERVARWRARRRESLADIPRGRSWEHEPYDTSSDDYTATTRNRNARTSALRRLKLRLPRRQSPRRVRGKRSQQRGWAMTMTTKAVKAKRGANAH
ncbi:uncharacterized protein LOC128718340 [Anopheles marshallii]|uniref:uncharacterized protein LOC128718340 n=1 Tax=Anopheles marshallii TaxID=1521116 RepID=UPI00237A4E27|nr:uncharacterized protein LOC128718340 [Anopheles marshallii]